VVIPEGRNASSITQACRVVADARERIVDGASEFSTEATSVSDMNPERGGDLGWLHRKDLAAWMANSIDTLESGGLSPVIEMPFGCNLLQLVDRRRFEPITFEQAAPQLQSFIYNEKMELEYTRWLDVLREQTYIERKGAFGS
jgi:peptidyl-prolyl cis-trans isomerase SurA